MKKTVWVTGLLAALVAMGVWSLPLEQQSGEPDDVVNAPENIEADETSQRLAGLANMDWVKRGIFECRYHDNKSSSLNKVLIRGTDSCKFLDGSEAPEEKERRIADYVNAYLPGVFQPEKTRCFAVQFSTEDKSRNVPISEYIEQMNKLPISQNGRAQAQLSGRQLENVMEAENTIRTKLQGEIHRHETLYGEQSCQMLLVAENEPSQSGASFRGCARSCMNGAGMFVTKLSSAGASVLSWVWTRGKKFALPLAGGWFYNRITTTPGFKAAIDKLQYGEFGPNVTRHAGGLVGFWNTEVTTTAIGTSNTVGDCAAGLSTIGLIYYRAKVMAALSAMYGYVLSRGAVPQHVKQD
ncbi:hypothetical protein [Endozoicomonas euniceicola]|uniref:Uncharacterized protein n=1 Tax=Endozoicomonas euniceicola TaxID=1234143 RepID=A0ABY6GQ05_9GAMM|nr:hypothetical protein [Endozoicomonas euniceicola]UYM14231.1 hypothetical protein NX720_15130 [Endozoicomonas euniceicola]